MSSRIASHSNRFIVYYTRSSSLELVALSCCWILSALPLSQQEVWIALFVKTGFLSVLQAGHVATVEQGCIAIGTLAVATLQGRLNLRTTIVIGALMVALANTLSMIDSLLFFITGRVLSGLALGAIMVAMVKIATFRASSHKTFSLVAAATVFSASVYAFTVPAVLARYGIPGLFAVPILVACFTAVVAFLGVSDAHAEGRSTAVARYSVSLAPILGCIAMFSTAAGVMAYMSFIYVIGGAMGYSLAQLARAVAIGSSFAVFGPLVAHRLGVRAGLRVPLVAALSLVVLVIQVQPRVHALWSFASGAALISASMMFYFPYALDLIRRIDPYSWWVTTATAFVLGGNAAGPAIGGWTLERLSFQALPVCACLLISIGIALFCLAHRLGAGELARQFRSRGGSGHHGEPHVDEESKISNRDGRCPSRTRKGQDDGT